MAVTTEPAREKSVLHLYPESTVETTFFSHHGIYSLKYNGLCALTESIVVMASGRFVLFVDVKLGTVKFMHGSERSGVGAIAVHPSRRFYVVCEKAPSDPLIRAYSWPLNEEVGQFVGGATRGFSACSFNADGSMMATVGLYPDYSLAVWNWKTRCIILRSKSHSVDVYTVRFSGFDSGSLVTGGGGHIKFWSMAKTFTGMKLQGMLGKFGRLEISNVSGFVVLADGKVLSGSECGLFLLWEGELVRCCFARSVENNAGDATAALALQSYNYTPCHNGPINVVELLDGNCVVLTAGDDGYMRYWLVSELEAAEGEGAPPLYAPECLCEVLVSPNARIRAATICHDTAEWVLLDSTGALWRVPYLSEKEILSASATRATEPAVVVLRFNGGGITSLAMSPCDHTAVTGGEDGSIRFIDYVTPREVYQLFLPGPTAVVALHFFKTDVTGGKFIACCDNGTVWLLQRGKEAFGVLGRWRPHEKGLKAVAIDPEERRLCTVSTDGTAFFFNISVDLLSLEPIGFCHLPLKDVECIAWDNTTSCCLVGYNCGKLLAIYAPLIEEMDHKVSFEFTCRYALVGIRQRKKVEKKVIPEVVGERLEQTQEADTEDEDEVVSWPIRIICNLPDDTFAVGSGASELLYQYTTRIRYENSTELPPLPPTGIEPPDYIEEPMVNLCYRDLTPQSACVSSSKKFLTVICETAQIILRPIDFLSNTQQRCVLVAAAHDTLDGHITGACTSFDDTMVVSVALDGLVVAQLLKDCPAPSQPQVEELYPSLRAEECVLEPQPVTLSISEQKKADDLFSAEKEKEREIDAFLEKLKVVHAKYEVLWNDNNSFPPSMRLSEEEMALHPQILQEMEEEKKRRVKEARKENALKVAREELRTRKLRNKFIDNLIYDRFQVHSFSKKFIISSFRTPKPDRAIKELEAVIEELLLSDKEETKEGGDGREKDTTNSNNDFDNCDNVNKTKEEVKKDAENKKQEEVSAAVSATSAQLGKEEQTVEQEQQQKSLTGTKNARPGSELLTSTMRQYFLKMDERREERLSRKKGYELLMSRKPEPADEAEKLKNEIKREMARRGECILRTDPSYNSVLSAVQKLKELIKLETHVVDLRTGFNKKLLALRDEKKQLCELLNKILSRIREINERLKEESDKAADVCLLSIELPEQRFVIDHDTLDAFAKKQYLEKLREEAAKKALRAFGADLQVSDEASKGGIPAGGVSSSDVGDVIKGGSRQMSALCGRSSALLRSKSQRPVFDPTSRPHNTSTGGSLRERMDHDLRVKLDNLKPTEAEEEEQQMERELLIAERSCLQLQIDAMMEAFDEKLWQLYEERAEIDADLCLAHARSLLMFNEYMIMLVFRHKDRELRQQYEEAKNSRDKHHREVVELQKSLREKAAEIEKLQETNKTFCHEVEFFIETHFPSDHVPYVKKIFLRQIKRRKHFGDISAEDDDITSDDDEEDVNEDDLVEEVCPPNCSEENWLSVLEKRETRLDYVDAITNVRRQHDLMQRRIEEQTMLGGQQEAALTMSLKAIEDFQSEKRKQLNMLETLVSLRCSQVKCLDDDDNCPDAFIHDDLVVISDDVMAGLRNRIKAMAEEKQMLSLTLNNMLIELQQLQRVQSAKKALQAQWEEKVYESMLLKFGQVVDLERLEATSSCREVEELKEQLRMEELMWDRELRLRENKIIMLRSQLQSELVHNTHLLHDLGDQQSDLHKVESSLSQATHKVVSRMYDGSNVATAEDRHNLKLLIAAQQEEIDALHAEVSMLRSKCGQVYALSAAPSLPAQQGEKVVDGAAP